MFWISWISISKKNATPGDDKLVAPSLEISTSPGDRALHVWHAAKKCAIFRRIGFLEVEYDTPLFIIPLKKGSYIEQEK
jgi:hypothetical protein